MRFSRPGPFVPIQALPFDLFTAPRKSLHGGGEGGLTMA